MFAIKQLQKLVHLYDGGWGGGGVDDGVLKDTKLNYPE